MNITQADWIARAVLRERVILESLNGRIINGNDMKWLSIEYIKQHSRIDFDCEDELLVLYGDAAEETVLNVLNRSYEDIMEEYGEVPSALIHASLLLVDLSYQQRSAVSVANLYTVPYSFDLMVKPYMRLATGC